MRIHPKRVNLYCNYRYYSSGQKDCKRKSMDWKRSDHCSSYTKDIPFPWKNIIVVGLEPHIVA